MSFLHYNFCRIHQSIDITPTMTASIADTLYDMEWIVDRVAELEPKLRRPKIYRKRFAARISK